jgi:hypothetical protein
MYTYKEWADNTVTVYRPDNSMMEGEWIDVRQAEIFCNMMNKLGDLK